MTERFFEIAFTPSVKAAQDANGSRSAYARMESESETAPDLLTEQEAKFIAIRDSFYMATVSETGWPYVQHRGGPPGFVKVLGPSLLGMADFRGNRQYVTLGNVSKDDRASLFFMDYPMRQRLKLLVHVRSVDLADQPDLAAQIVDADYGAKVERAFLFQVEAYDWNCPQHITPRFTLEEVRPTIEAMEAQIADLEAQLEALRQGAG